MLIGMETLSLRFERHAANAMMLSKWLEAQSHRMAKKHLKNGWCSVLTFDLVGGKLSAFKLIDGFKMIITAAKCNSYIHSRQL